MAKPQIQMNSRTSQLRLPSGLSDGKFSFVSATVFDEPPLPFAIVEYEVSGKSQPYGLRMDLDKRAFLDDVRNANLQKVMADFAEKVAFAIGQARSDKSSTRQATAGR